MHERIAGAGHRRYCGKLGLGPQPSSAGHHREQDVPDPAGERKPVILADAGNQLPDRRVAAKQGQPVQQLGELADHRVLGPRAVRDSERIAGQPGQRNVAPAERGVDVAGRHRHRDGNAGPAQRFQQRHGASQPAPGLLVAGEPVRRLAGQDDVMELSGHQPCAVSPVSGQPNDLKVTGKPLVHPGEDNQQAPGDAKNAVGSRPERPFLRGPAARAGPPRSAPDRRVRARAREDSAYSP